MLLGTALGVLAGAVLLVLATVIHRAGRARPDNQIFAATAVLAGLHVMLATLVHVASGVAGSSAALGRFALFTQAIVAGLLVLFARAFATSRRAPWWLWLVSVAACVLGGWVASSSGLTDDLPRASASIVSVPYLLASFEVLRGASRERGARRSGLLAVAGIVVARMGTGFLLAEHWLGTAPLIHLAERVVPIHAYLDVAQLIAIGMIVLRYHLLDVRRVFREAAMPLGVALLAAVYGAGALAAGPWLSGVVGVAGSTLALLLPPLLAGWAVWTWNDALERASAAIDPRRRVRREVVERVLAVTASVVDAEAVLAMVRASMLGVLEGGDVQFRRAEGNNLLPGISPTVPGEFEAPLCDLAEAVVQARALSGRDGDGQRDWPQGQDDCLLVPVRRNGTLYGVFELRKLGRVHGDDLATVVALADHLAMKLENLRLYSSLGRAGRELADVKVFLEDLIESLPVGVVGLVGPELRVRLWNPAEARRTGISRENAIGKPYLEEVAGTHIAPAIAEAIRKSPTEVMSFPNVDWSGATGGASVDVTVAPLRARGMACEGGYVLILVDTSERNALQREIEEFRRLAALGQFAAAIAHDVRTPLSSMRMSVQILRSKVELPAEDAEYFDLILESITRLGRQVDELVEFTKPALMRTESLDLAEVIHDACGDLAQKAKAKAVVVKPLVEAGLVAAVDETKLRQAVANLLCNAIEASCSGGTVVVSGRVDGPDQVVLRVTDRGAGIAPADLERIWEPFYTTRPDGTGLGLAIVRKNVMAHGGSIQVSSRPGEGTTFEIRLPVRRATEVLVPIEECRGVTAAE